MKRICSFITAIFLLVSLVQPVQTAAVVENNLIVSLVSNEAVEVQTDVAVSVETFTPEIVDQDEVMPEPTAAETVAPASDAALPVNEEPSAIMDSGACGDNLTWTLDEQGTLTISGTGAMWDWGFGTAPWYSYKGSINKIAVENGVTTVGNSAFDGCTFLSSVALPNSITSIGRNAFRDCAGLTSISIPGRVTSMKLRAFARCSSLTEIYFKGKAPTFDQDVFRNVTATAYYPANDPTWTESVRQNYGGTIQWTAQSYGELEYTLSADETYYIVAGIGTYADEENVNIPETREGKPVKEIGPGAFRDCTNVAVVTIPASITTIGDYAFDGCTNLIEITIPASVTSIGVSAFLHCSSLEGIWVDRENPNYRSDTRGVLFNKELTTLIQAPGALNGKYSVSRQINKIENSAFAGCAGLSEIHFDGSAPTFGEDVFAGVTAMAYYSASDETWTEEVRQGYGGTITWAMEASVGMKYTLSEDGTYYIVTGIGNCRDTIVVIPSTCLDKPVKEIGVDAFKDCGNLKGIIIPDSVTAIGDRAFSRCYSLERVVIGSGVTTIGSYAFDTCIDLAEIAIPEGVTEIGNSAFSGCTSVTAITIPESVTEIGNSAFENCTSLTAVTILANVTEIGTEMFGGCTALTDITIPDSVATIGSLAFRSCTSLGKLIVPDSVTAIGSYAFQDCAGLTKIILSANISEITVGMFYGCTSLNSIIIPDGVTSIGTHAFSGCTSLASVTIPDRVTTLNGCAFDACSSLEEIVIPKRVTHIGECVFRGCSGLTGIWVDAENPNYSSDSRGVLFNKEKTTLIVAPGAISGSYVIPDSVDTINKYAFYGYTDLVSVTIGSGVAQILEGAFLDCTGLKEIRFLCSAPACGDGAFRCVTATAYYPAKDPTWTLEVRNSYGSTITWVAVFDASEGLEYTLSTDKTYYIVSGIGNCTDTEIILPSTVDGKPVKEVGSSAFKNCTGITAITIPDSITKIGEQAFRGCTALQEIRYRGSAPTFGDNAFASVKAVAYYPANDDSWTEEVCRNYGGTLTWTPYTEGLVYTLSADGTYYILTGMGTCTDEKIAISATFQGKPVREIRYTAFFECDWVTSVIIPDSVTTIDDGAFSYLSNLTHVSLGNGVTTIGQTAFSYCSSLAEIRIPASVTSIGQGAFYFCSSLTGIWVDEKNPNYSSDDAGVLFDKEKTTLMAAPGAISGSYVLPTSVTTLHESAFTNCTKLTHVTMGERIRDISWCAFAGCTSLESIVIPDSVTTIQARAFQGCSGLNSVILGSCVETIGGAAFKDCTSLKSVTIPGSVTDLGPSCFSGCTSMKEVFFLGNAPHTDYDLFYGVVATVYYPRNSDWTEEKRHDYGGQLTWVAADPIAEQLQYRLSDDGTYFIVIGIGSCTSSEIVIPSVYNGKPVKEIANYAFRENEKLTSVLIPYGITNIGAETFRSCKNLVNVKLPESITTIGSAVFGGCHSLASINIPESVTTIDEAAFVGCSSLPSITIPDNVTYIGAFAFSECFSAKTLTIGSGLTRISPYAFSECTSLVDVTIEGNIAAIANRAFYCCTSLENITISEKVTTIGSEAFAACTAMEKICFKGNAPAFDEFTFRNTTATAYYPANDPTWTEEVRQNYGGTITWECYYGEGPGDIIASGDCGDSMTWELYGEGVLVISGTGTMWSWTSLSVPWYEYKDMIKKVAFTSGMNANGTDAANSATDTTTIGAWAFYACSNLSEVELPENLISIGDWAFGSCNSLVTITIPNNTADIGKYAFESCTSMTSLKIGSGMKTLGDAAFGSCNSLKEIYFTGNAPVFGIEVFSGVTATVYYPENDETWTEEVRQNYGGTIIWTAEAPFTVGDANGDGTVNPLDALMLLQCYIGMLNAETLTFAACDCNGDGTVNPLDALLVLQYYIGIIHKFPVE